MGLGIPGIPSGDNSHGKGFCNSLDWARSGAAPALFQRLLEFPGMGCRKVAGPCFHSFAFLQTKVGENPTFLTLKPKVWLLLGKLPEFQGSGMSPHPAEGGKWDHCPKISVPQPQQSLFWRVRSQIPPNPQSHPAPSGSSPGFPLREGIPSVLQPLDSSSLIFLLQIRFFLCVRDQSLVLSRSRG